MLYYQVMNNYHQEGDYPKKMIYTWDLDTVNCQLD